MSNPKNLARRARQLATQRAKEPARDPREKYEALRVVDLKEIAKKRGVKIKSGLRKAQIIDLLL